MCNSIGKIRATWVAIAVFAFVFVLLPGAARAQQSLEAPADPPDSQADPGFLEYRIPEEAENPLLVQIAAMGVGAKSENGADKPMAVFEMRIENLSEEEAELPVHDFRVRDAQNNRSGSPEIKTGKRLLASPVEVGPGETRVLSLSFPFSALSTADGPVTLYLIWSARVGDQDYSQESEFNPYQPSDPATGVGAGETGETYNTYNTYNSYNSYNGYGCDGCCYGPYGYCPGSGWLVWWWYRPVYFGPYYRHGWWHHRHRQDHRGRHDWERRHGGNDQYNPHVGGDGAGGSTDGDRPRLGPDRPRPASLERKPQPVPGAPGMSSAPRTQTDPNRKIIRPQPTPKPRNVQAVPKQNPKPKTYAPKPQSYAKPPAQSIKMPSVAPTPKPAFKAAPKPAKPAAKKKSSGSKKSDKKKDDEDDKKKK